MKIVFLIVFVFLFPVISQAQVFSISSTNVVQGDTLVVRISSQWQKPGAGVLLWDSNYLSNKNGYVYVGIRVDVEPGKYQVFLTEYGRIKMDVLPLEFEVLERNFSEWFRGKSPVLNKVVRERLVKDRELKNKAYESANLEENYTTGKYVEPLDYIEVKDEFGAKRIYGAYDKKKKNIRVEKIVSHGGVDLKAQIPTKVMAINSGRVLFDRHLLADGNILILDHGSGIISLYLHLSRFLVKEGDKVKRGQAVAYTGATGTDAEPHLHFMIKVHKTNVDPLRFIEIMNSVF